MITKLNKFETTYSKKWSSFGLYITIKYDFCSATSYHVINTYRIKKLYDY